MSRVKSILLLMLILSLLAFPCFAVAPKTLSIQVKEGQLRSTPSFLGRIVAQVSYGDRVTVLEDRGAWQKVAAGGGRIQGWIHASALTTKKIALRTGSADVQTGAGSAELALAGKGFNAKVEAEFKNKSKLDFIWVDRMEKMTVQPAQMETFLREGKVIPPHRGGQ